MKPASPEGHRPDRMVLVLSSDLFFSMRIRDALKQLGYASTTLKSEQEFVEALNGEDITPVLGLIDFNQQRDWSMMRDSLIDARVPTVAFGPHKDTDGFKAARDAGVTRVISNGAFTSSLPDVVQKYAAPPPDDQDSG